jgi:Tfp pilus assembly PilM family ATPase
MTLGFFYPPEFLRLPVFGLDISQSSIRIAKLKKTSFGMVPSEVARIAISETCELFTGQNSHTDCQEVKKVLRELRKKHAIEFARVSIPEEKTYVFRVALPNDALHSIEEFILYNMDQYIPLDPQEVIFDYKVLHDRKGPESTPVVVTAVPRQVIEVYTEIVESAGISLVACEPETHAIARSVIHKDDTNPYIIINVDAFETTVSVVEDGFVQYTQTLSLSGKDVAGTISPQTASILKEGISKVIVFWFTSKDHAAQGARIENVILTGEGVGSSSLINFLESNLSVNAAFGNVWRNCLDLNDHVPQISKSDSLQYATCVGLCLAKTK